MASEPSLESSAVLPPPSRREIVSWAMFDFANSSYTTIIVSVAFGIYFTRLVAPEGKGDSLWGLAILLGNLFVLLLSPVIGAVADDSGRKKLFLAFTYATCVVGTGLLWFVTPGRVALGLVLFVLSFVGFSFGENLASSFLPEISTPENVGRISGFGWGLGYFGGLACLVLVLPLLKGGYTLENLGNLRLAWLATALFFLVAALPTTSVIAFAGIFAERTLKFTSLEVTYLFIALQLTSAGGAFLFGYIQDRVGASRTIQAALVIWILVCVGTYYCQSKELFWVIAMGAGLGIGSLQSASRGMVGLFSPPEKSGEFFGFWGLAGKGAYMLGPFIFGLISTATGSQRVAILSTAIFFIAGLIGMAFIDERRGHAEAESWNEGRDSPPV
jgi:UMF1 family MFS transporter